MDIGRQSLMVNDFAAQSCESVTLLARKRTTHIRFVRDHDLRKPLQCAFALLRKNELGMSPVSSAAFSLNQFFAGEFVDQENHSAWKNTEKFGQTLLI